MAYTSPSAPEGLNSRATALWKNLHEMYSFDPHEDILVEQLCRAVMMADDLRSRQAEEDFIGEGAMGQPVAAPLVTEMRQWDSNIKGLITALKLPVTATAAPVGDNVQDISDKMRALVMKRHHPQRAAGSGAQG